MSKRILILVGIPDFDYSNQMSAVASFLGTIKAAFEKEGHEVEFANNAKPVQNQSAVSPKSGGLKLGLKKILKNWPWLYHSIGFRSFFKRQNQLSVALLKKAPFDQVVEFHTVGSTVGKQLAAKWGAHFSVVFDSPVGEQFYEMHSTRSMHWSRIVNSEKETLESADNIMAYSPACEAYIQVKYKLKGKVRVLPCVIHKENTINEPLAGTFNIAFIGSFLSWHKVNTLVSAFSKFHQKYPESKLQLIGYGVEWMHIKNKVNALSISQVVDMPGFVSETELIDYKRKCTVAIMPGSNWYGSPLKLFEYAQSGIAFIAPTTKTVSSIFANQEHCLFIDSSNEENSLLEKLTFLYENPLKRSELATSAYNYVKTNFAKAIYGEKLVEALSAKY